MLLFYLRHGEPIYNPDSLTPFGHEQAEALSKRLALCKLDRIYTSTSNRAKQTAEPTVRATGIEAVELSWTHENRAWEDFSLQTEDEKKYWCFQIPKYKILFNSPDMVKLGNDWTSHPDIINTTLKQGKERIDREVDNFMLSFGFRHDRAQQCYFAEQPSEERVALFAHQGFGMAFFSSLLDIPYPLFCTHFDLSHSSMSVVEFYEAEDRFYPRILQLSNDSHLYKEELSRLYNHHVEL